MNRERRNVLRKAELRALTDAEKSAGYIGAIVGVIPFNSDSGVLRDRRLNNGQPFVERIAPKAFAGFEDVIGVAGHTDDPMAAFARQGANLTFTETDTELRWEALLLDTTDSRDLVTKINGKIVRGTSFEFDLGAEDKWEKRGDGTAVRTVTRGKLATVNPVLWPAYDDGELSVSMRSRTRRDSYYGNDIAWDPTSTADQVFAVYAFGEAVCGLTDALEYLRASPAGALVPYAQKRVTDCAAAVTELAAWLAANGAQVDPDYLERAKAKVTEARGAAGAKPISKPDEAARERRRRALSISPASPLASAT